MVASVNAAAQFGHRRAELTHESRNQAEREVFGLGIQVVNQGSHAFPCSGATQRRARRGAMKGPQDRSGRQAAFHAELLDTAYGFAVECNHVELIGEQPGFAEVKPSEVVPIEELVAIVIGLGAGFFVTAHVDIDHGQGIGEFSMTQPVEKQLEGTGRAI